MVLAWCLRQQKPNAKPSTIILQLRSSGCFFSLRGRRMLNRVEYIDTHSDEWKFPYLKRCLITPFFHSFTTHSLFVRSFAHSFIHSFVPSFIHSITHSLMSSCVRSFIRLVVHVFLRSFFHSLFHSFIHSFIRSCSHSFIHSFIFIIYLCIHSHIYT